MLEKLSLPGESAGTGAFLMAGYCVGKVLARAVLNWRSQLKRNKPCVFHPRSGLTDVVLTPQGSAAVVQEAGGVSMNSKSSGD